MKLYLGADHAGFQLKEQLKRELTSRRMDYEDLSPVFVPDDDYPKHAKRVAAALKKDSTGRGILVCGSGVGVSIAANRIKGIRAFDAHGVAETKLAREHNDVNVISLSGWRLDVKEAMQLVQTFLKTPFSKAARHHRRIKQLG